MSEHAPTSAAPREPLPFAIDAVADAHKSGALRCLARALARAGLRPGALWPLLGMRYANRLAIETLGAPAEIRTLAQSLLWLFVAGRPVPSQCFARERGDAAGLLETLEALGFVDSDGVWVAARVSILPVAEKLLLCEAPSRAPHRELVAAPDLSAFHMIARIGRRGAASWLDVATGTGVIGLAGSRARCALLGTDLNPRAIAYAQVSSWLNGAPEARWRCADLFDSCEEGRRFELVTFNPPIAEDEEACDDLPLYVAGAPGLVDRFWREVSKWVEPDGEVVTHSAVPEDPDFPASLGLPGAFFVFPFDLGPRDRFCITSWRPGAPDAVVIHPTEPGERPTFGC